MDDLNRRDRYSSMDYYSILGVNNSSTDAEIKKAYYAKALRCHPDKNSDPVSTAEFQKLSQAYQVLSDDERRSAYDRYGTIPDKFQDAGTNFKHFINLFMKRWNIGEEVSTLVNDTISNMRPGKEGFADMMGKIDKNKLLTGGLGIAKQYISNYRSSIRDSRISQLDIRAWRYEIKIDEIGRMITIPIDIPIQIAYSHIEIVFYSSTGQTKSITQFIDFDTELDIHIWGRDICIGFSLAELEWLTRVNEWDVILRDRVNPCQLSGVWEWTWEYGSIVLKNALSIGDTTIFRFEGEGLMDWVEKRRGTLWVCFTVDMGAPVRPLLDRIDDETPIMRSLSFENVLANQ